MRKNVGHMMQDHATNDVNKFQASCYIFKLLVTKVGTSYSAALIHTGMQ